MSATAKVSFHERLGKEFSSEFRALLKARVGLKFIFRFLSSLFSSADSLPPCSTDEVAGWKLV